jgi:hypothetical protein
MAREPWPVTATGPGAMVSADIRGWPLIVRGSVRALLGGERCWAHAS